MHKYRIAFVFAIGLLAACTALKPFNKRAELQRIVSECVKNQTDNNKPAPCEAVDIFQGYAVLKDKVGIAQYLVLPTQPISGIESPMLLADSTPNYWEAAWSARKYVAAKLGKEPDREHIGMAVNSPLGRTQDDLHIHIDCVKPEVAKALATVKDTLGFDWVSLPFPLAGHNYQAMRVYSEDMRGINPFSLLGIQGDMEHKTLVVIGAVFPRNNGYILLSDTADIAKGDLASGEELLDHSCAIENAPKAP